MTRRPRIAPVLAARQPCQPDGDTRCVQEHQTSGEAVQENSRRFFTLSESSVFPWQVYQSRVQAVIRPGSIAKVMRPWSSPVMSATGCRGDSIAYSREEDIVCSVTYREWVPRLCTSTWFDALLDGVNVAAVALMAAVTLTLGRDAIVDPGKTKVPDPVIKTQTKTSKTHLHHK
jgi:hypothetical protein